MSGVERVQATRAGVRLCSEPTMAPAQAGLARGSSLAAWPVIVRAAGS